MFVYGGYSVILSMFYSIHLILAENFKSASLILDPTVNIIVLFIMSVPCVAYHGLTYYVPADIIPRKEIRRAEKILVFSILCLFVFQVFDLILWANDVHDLWFDSWIFKL